MFASMESDYPYIFTDGKSSEELEELSESMEDLDESEALEKLMPKCELSGNTIIEFSKFLLLDF
jgi:hypothetical protein